MGNLRTHSGRMLFIGVISLLGIGIAMVYSSSAILAMHHYKDSLYFLKKQILWSILGMGLLLGISMMDYQRLRALSRGALIIGIVLLCLTLHPLFSKEVNGARRWIRFGPICFQSSEFARVAIIMFMADLLSRKGNRSKKGLFPIICIPGFLCGLILAQPHLGMASLIFIVCMAMILISGKKIPRFGYLFGVVLLPPLCLLSSRFDYVRERIVSFLNPWEDPLGGGYQIIQSLIALASGGPFGKGPGASYAKLFYLPYPHTDFIFAIIGEEFGLIGTLLVVGLFLWFGIWGMRIAWEARDLFGGLLAMGLTSSVTLQAILNMGAVTRIFPVIGLPLPFISFGGSNLVCSLLSAGIILSIWKGSSKRCVY